MRHDPGFYRSPEWIALRKAYVAAHPNCETPGCGGRTRHVDHRIPRKRGGLPLDWSNLRAYCTPCHSRKTAAADGGFGNPTRSEPFEPRAKGSHGDGSPRDPKHPWFLPPRGGGD